MPDKKISALTSASLPLAGTELVPIVQGGVTVKTQAADLFQWPGGRVSYVPVGGNIQAYVTAATAGDTLILGAGTYTVTATITVDKAILIKGQGLSATKVVTSTADLAVFTFGAGASSAKITDLYVGNTGTGTSFAFFAGDGLSQLQISNVIAVLGGNGLKYGIWSQSSITVSNCEMYITSADLNSNGVMIYNETGATANINANIQNVRVLSTGATLNNRGIVFNNNNVANTIAGNVTNCNLNAYASTGVTDIALYVNSTTTNNVTVNAYNSLFDGDDSDVTVIGTNSCTLSNCTLTHGTTTGTVVYAGTQVTKNLRFGGTLQSSSQPSFLVTAPGVTNVTGDATLYQVIFSTKVYDQANNVDANGVFTAPVAGNYYFTARVSLAMGVANTNTPSQIRLVTTGAANPHQFWQSFPFLIIDGTSLQIGQLCKMAAGDTALIQIYVGNGTKNVGLYGDASYYTSFSGALLY